MGQQFQTFCENGAIGAASHVGFCFPNNNINLYFLNPSTAYP